MTNKSDYLSPAIRAHSISRTKTTSAQWHSRQSALALTAGRRSARPNSRSKPSPTISSAAADRTALSSAASVRTIASGIRSSFELSLMPELFLQFQTNKIPGKIQYRRDAQARRPSPENRSRGPIEVKCPSTRPEANLLHAGREVASAGVRATPDKPTLQGSNPPDMACQALH